MVRGTHKNAFREYVTSKAAGLSALLADPLLGEVKAALVDGAPRVGNFQVHGTWPAFLQEALRTCSGNPELHSVVMALLEKEQSSASSATHHEKRRLLRGLGLLGTSGYSVGKILAESPSFDAAAAVLKARGIKLIARSRRTASDLGYKRGYQLVEDPAYMTAKSILCTEDEGFYVIPPGESAVFVSGTGTETDPYVIELAVIRNCLGEEAFAAPLLAWLDAVIHAAVGVRRNQRPNQPGAMVQIGLNMGPRHARVLGWGKSFNKPNLSQEEMTAQDTDFIGAQSLLWLLINSNFPTEVPAAFAAGVADLPYPALGTQNVPSEMGFSFEYDGKDYNFTQAGRAPPEGIALLGFRMGSHTDDSPVPFTVIMTCSREDPKAPALAPGLGANLVDLTLKTVVQAAPATLMAFNSNKLHGTTNHGAGIDPTNSGLGIFLTKRVHDAIRDAVGKSGYDGVVYAGAPITDLSGNGEQP
ncbi:hypothetical protein DFP72DRAFT_1108472 [Ephemerocybe angulata]|uniref:Uncharacterized protein n=1 Tax=Ephemerocybe angulata TaxID=980116 RepID=A0A8H6IHG4_9AGAR|nr:hypothetical protein DFP72DRAFT_1108472 [Tulosesus angulatus]